MFLTKYVSTCRHWATASHRFHSHSRCGSGNRIARENDESAPSSLRYCRRASCLEIPCAALGVTLAEMPALPHSSDDLQYGFSEHRLRIFRECLPQLFLAVHDVGVRDFEVCLSYTLACGRIDSTRIRGRCSQQSELNPLVIRQKALGRL
jgi:hypothetical protein